MGSSSLNALLVQEGKFDGKKRRPSQKDDNIQQMQKKK